MIVEHALDRRPREVEVTKEAEDAWVELLLIGPGPMLGSPDCTPGYYNNEGQDPAARGATLFVGYPAGAMAYFQYLDELAQLGRLRGPRVPLGRQRRISRGQARSRGRLSWSTCSTTAGAAHGTPARA